MPTRRFVFRADPHGSTTWTATTCTETSTVGCAARRMTWSSACWGCWRGWLLAFGQMGVGVGQSLTLVARTTVWQPVKRVLRWVMEVTALVLVA